MQTHLYRRGATYYWRRLIPNALQPALGARDLRTSLRTNIPETARSRASRMDAAFDLVLEDLEQIVRSGQVLSNEVKSRLVRELRQEIIEKAEADRVMAGICTPQDIAAAVAKALRLHDVVRGLVARSDLTRGEIQADRLLAREGIQLDRTSLEYRLLSKDLLVGMRDAFAIVADDEQGNETFKADASEQSDGICSEQSDSICIDQSDGIRTKEQIQADKANMRAPFSVHAKASWLPSRHRGVGAPVT